MKKLVFLVTGLLFIVGCYKIPKTGQTIQQLTTKHCDVSSFDSVLVGNNSKTKLVNGNYGVDINGTSNVDYQCPTIIDNHILDTTKISNKETNTVIKISAPKFKNISVTGNATLSATKLKTEDLTILAKHNGTVNLAGTFNINKITQFGNGRINIELIDSDSLTIEGSGGGPIYVVGQVNNLMIKLAREAKLYARYLRTQTAKAFTTDSAIAELLVIDTLDAYAINSSNIYYYKKPKNLTVVTKERGNVLYPHGVK